MYRLWWLCLRGDPGTLRIWVRKRLSSTSSCLNFLSCCTKHFLKIKILCVIVNIVKCTIYLASDHFNFSRYFLQAMSAWQFNWSVLLE